MELAKAKPSRLQNENVGANGVRPERRVDSWIPAFAGMTGMNFIDKVVIPAKPGWARAGIQESASSSIAHATKKLGLQMFLAITLLLITACSGPLLELPCIDLPGTPETCPDENSPSSSTPIEIAWDCAECSSIRQGTAPLAVQLWLKGISSSAEEPVLWEIAGLNSNLYERDFSRADERFSFTFEIEETYRVQASFNNSEIEPIEFRVDVNETSAKWSTPWRTGELCDARLHYLGDPETMQEVPYWIEVIVKADGLENVSVIDRVPYRVKYPEYTQSWRITPHKSTKPYLFPTQLQPQVIQFDGSGRRNFIWDIFVKCISPNTVEEFSITTRL